MSDLKYTVEVTGLKDVEQLEKNLDRLHNTLNAGQGSGKSLEEMRKILVGMRGQSSIISDLRDSIKGLNTATDQLSKNFDSGFKQLDRTFKQGFQLVLDRVNMFGAEYGNALGTQLTKGMESAGQKAKTSGEKLAGELKNIRKKLADSSTAQYEGLVSGNPLQKLNEKTAKELLELQAHGARLSSFHKTVVDEYKKYGTLYTQEMSALEAEKQRARDKELKVERSFNAELSKIQADRQAELSKLRDKSAPRRHSEDEVRLLLGMPTRSEMASASNSLKAQLRDAQKEADQVSKLRDKSAPRRHSEDEVRLLLGMPTRSEMASASNSLKAQLRDAQKEADQVSKLRDKSAPRRHSEDEVRLLLGMPTRSEMASASNSLKAQLRDAQKEADQVSKLRDKSAPRRHSEDEVRLLLGMPTRSEMASSSAALKADIIARRKELEDAVRSSVRTAINAPSGTYQVYSPASGLGGQIREIDELGRVQEKATKTSGSLSNSLRILAIDGNDTHSAMRGLASGFNLLWLTWGNLAPLFAGAAISNGFVQTAKTGMEVAHTLAIIENIGGNTKDEVAALNQELLRLGKTGPFGPQEVAEAMKTLSLAGLKATEILSATQSTLNFSIAGTTSIQTAADTLVSVTTAFGMGAQGFERVGDVISKAAAESKTSVESFANAMKTASVIGAQYGVSLEDTATAIATMSQLGIEGTAAGTALRNMYADLSGRSAQVTKVLKAQGIEMRDLTTGGFKPMVQVVAELSDHFDGLTAIGQKNLIQALLSERGAKGLVEMLRLIKVEAKDTSKGFANALEEMRKNIEESYGFAAVNAAKLSQTTKSLFEQMGATLKTSMYEAFTEIEPILSTIARELKLAFGSEDFKESLTTLVRGVAEVGRSLVQVGVFATENIAIVAMLAAGYKAFTIAANLSAAAQLALTAATKADTAANAANAASQAAKLTGIAAFARFLPGVGTAITVAAGAWALYDAYQRDSSKSGLEFARNYTSDVVKALNDETSKLKELNRLRREGLTLTEAQARLDALDKKAQYVDPYAQTVHSAIKAELAARAELSKRQQEYANYAAKDNKHRVEEQERVVKRLSQQTQAAKAEELAAINQINKATEDAVAARKEAADLDAIDFENRKKLAQVFGKNTFELGAGGGDAGGNSFVDLNRDKELQALKAHYDAELAVANDYYNKSKQLLDGHRSANLISEEEYMVQSLRLSRSHEAEQLQVLEASLTAYTEASERRKAALESQMSGAKGKGKNMLLDQLKKETQEFEIFVTNYEKERAKVAAESYARVGETVLKLQTEVGKLLKSSEDFWDNAAISSAAQRDADELAKKYKNMNTSILSMDSAMYEFEKAQKSTQSEVKKMNAALEKQLAIQKNLLQIELLSLQAAQASGRLTLDEAILRATLISQFKEGIAELEGKIADNTEGGLELGAERGWDAFQKMREKQVEELANSMSEAVVDGLMSGDYKSIGKNIRDILQRELLRKPLIAIINGVMNEIVGGISNAIFGGGGGGGGLLGMASDGMSLYNTYQNAPGYINKATSFLGLGGGNAGLGLSAATAGGAMWGGTAASTGLGLSAGGTGLGMAAPTAGFWAPGTASVLPGAGAAGAAGSSGLMSGLQTAAPYAAAAVAVAAAFGAFRKTKIHDTGIMGTLGVEGGIHDFVQKRKDGSLFSGPKYWIEDHGVSAFDKPMQDAFSAMRTAAIDMGKILGLATDHLKDFTTVITLDSADSQSGTRGLNLKGLSDEEVQAKVQQALEQANNELAQQLIGTWEEVTTITKGRITETLQGEGEGAYTYKSFRFGDIKTTRTVYKPSEFAREGETAIETLTRLAQSLSVVNGTLDLLGLKLYEASLAGGDMASKLADLFGGLEAFTTVTSGYYQNFYSEEERFRKAGETVNASLRSIGVQLDVFGGEAAKVQYRELVEKAFAEGNNELAAQLLQMSAAFSEVANAAEQATAVAKEAAEQATAAAKEAANFLVDNALANLEAAVERVTDGLQEQISVLSEVVSSHKSLGDLLKKIVRDLRGEVESTRKWSADQGMLYIQNTLAKVKAGSNILDFTDLELAIDAARTGLSTKTYATQFEKDRDTLVLANQLEELDKLNGKQLSVEEKQLKVLQEQLDYYQAYLKSARDMVNGVNTLIDKTLSPEQAYALLLKSMSEAQGVGKGDLAYDDYIRRKAGAYTDPAIAAMQEKIKETAKSFEGSNDPIGLWKAITAAGGNEYDLNALYGWAVADLKDIIKYMGDAAYEDYLKRKVGAENDPTVAAMQQAIKDAAKPYEGTGDVKGMWEAIKKAGGNEFDLNALYGWAIEDLRKVIQDIGAGKYTPNHVAGPGTSPAGSGDAAADDYSKRTGLAILGGDAALLQRNINNTVDSFNGTGDVSGLWEAVKAAGGNEYDIANRLGLDVNDIRGVISELPSYDIGTNYVPKDIIAQVHEGEMIIPKRFNPATSGLDNRELVEEIKALREEVTMLRAEARATAINTSKTSRILDDVTQGGDTLTVTVAA